MACYHHQAEAMPYLTGQAAEPHSHNYQSQQSYGTHFPFLDGVGALFPSLSTSRKGSQDDTNANFDQDEAFSVQISSQAGAGTSTPRAYLTAHVHDTSSGHGPVTQTSMTLGSIPAYSLPYLSEQEMPEFRRRRAAREKHRIVPYHLLPAVLETPKSSPVETDFTSVDRDSEASSVHTEHIQAPLSSNHTPSNQSIKSRDDISSEGRDSAVEVISQDHQDLTGHTYKSFDTAWAATSPYGQWHAGGADS